jgi:hypothetical protein
MILEVKVQRQRLRLTLLDNQLWDRNRKYGSARLRSKRGRPLRDCDGAVTRFGFWCSEDVFVNLESDRDFPAVEIDCGPSHSERPPPIRDPVAA